MRLGSNSTMTEALAEGGVAPVWCAAVFAPPAPQHARGLGLGLLTPTSAGVLQVRHHPPEPGGLQRRQQQPAGEVLPEVRQQRCAGGG